MPRRFENKHIDFLSLFPPPSPSYCTVHSHLPLNKKVTQSISWLENWACFINHLKYIFLSLCICLFV